MLAVLLAALLAALLASLLAMAAAVPAETLTVHLGERALPFPTLAFVDRRGRKATWRSKTWVLVRGIERVLYGVEPGVRSTGRFATFLSSCTLRDAVLVAEKARVVDETLTQPEMDAGAGSLQSPCWPRLLLPASTRSHAHALMRSYARALALAAVAAMRQLVEPEGRARVNKASLLPISVGTPPPPRASPP